jgi:PadR family transcriptional regulator PadR
MNRKRPIVDFIELHILHHASESPIYGLWMLQELSNHGYRLNASQLYPKLHRLKREGLLTHRDENVNGKIRKYYRITARGRRYWWSQRKRLIELASEALTRDDLKKALERKR